MSRSKPWKELQFIKQIVIKPEDAKNPMWVEFKNEVEDIVYDDVRLIVNRDHSIKLVANAMYQVEMDYPEDFKKLVVACGSVREAYDAYKQLQKKVPDNWADYADEEIW